MGNLRSWCQYPMENDERYSTVLFLSCHRDADGLLICIAQGEITLIGKLK
jgi:hypothetical protein